MAIVQIENYLELSSITFSFFKCPDRPPSPKRANWSKHSPFQHHHLERKKVKTKCCSPIRAIPLKNAFLLLCTPFLINARFHSINQSIKKWYASCEPSTMIQNDFLLYLSDKLYCISYLIFVRHIIPIFVRQTIIRRGRTKMRRLRAEK